MVVEPVVLGYVHGGTVRAEFLRSVLDLITGPSPVRGWIECRSGGPNISVARNMVVTRFLVQRTEPWLFMVDTDMVFTEDAVSRLRKAADPVHRPVVGGLTWMMHDGERLATMFSLGDSEKPPLLHPIAFWEEGACVQVAATGAACLLVHRKALEKVALTSGDDAAPWFRELPSRNPMSLMSEDLVFCMRCQDAGIPIHVATSVQFGHVQSITLGEAA